MTVAVRTDLVRYMLLTLAVPHRTYEAPTILRQKMVCVR